MDRHEKPDTVFNDFPDDKETITLLFDKQDDISESLNKLMSETLGKGIVDSGSPETCAGDDWINIYIESLSSHDRKSVRSDQAEASFRFGAGPVVKSNRVVHLPVYISSVRAFLTVHVVPVNIPLLVSRKSLKTAGAVLDFQNDQVSIFGVTIPLVITQSNHYCINFSRSLENYQSPENRVFFSSPISSHDEKCYQKVEKLHKQFAHPESKRLIDTLRKTNPDDPNLLKIAEQVSESCKTCKIYKKTPLRPSVSLPTATRFNQRVAMDLKVINGKLVLMICIIR